MYKRQIERNVVAALAEDVGSGDLTARLVPADIVTRATVVARENAVLCGTAWFERCFARLDPGISITWQAADGDHAVPDQIPVSYTHLPIKLSICGTYSVARGSYCGFSTPNAVAS